jgi:hypothetical protein
MDSMRSGVEWKTLEKDRRWTLRTTYGLEVDSMRICGGV